MNSDGWGFTGAGLSDDRIAGEDLQHNRQTRSEHKAPQVKRITTQEAGRGPMDIGKFLVKQRMGSHDGHHMHHGHHHGHHEPHHMQHHLEEEKHRHEEGIAHHKHHLEKHHGRHFNTQHGHDTLKHKG